MDFDGTKRKQTIYVGGLHEDSNENELMEVFSAFGDIMDVQIPPAPTIHRDQPPTGHRGFAFVTFSSPADAQGAINNMDLNVIHGKVVNVNLAKAMEVEANPNRAGKLQPMLCYIMGLTFARKKSGSRRNGSKSIQNPWKRAEGAAFRHPNVQMPWKNGQL
ncbi:hypothetical protein FRC08_000399 [Ceratobasidium sp. 394]|nr:hypothetical protein FRC08_000399 [Ceratobasidium sp. 394]